MAAQFTVMSISPERLHDDHRAHRLQRLPEVSVNWIAWAPSAVGSRCSHLVRLAGGGELDELCVFRGRVIIEPALVLRLTFLPRPADPLWNHSQGGPRLRSGQFLLSQSAANLAVRIPPP